MKKCWLIYVILKATKLQLMGWPHIDDLSSSSSASLQVWWTKVKKKKVELLYGHAYDGHILWSLMSLVHTMKFCVNVDPHYLAL